MAEEESDLDSERFKQELESLFTRGNSDEPQSKYYCSRFCELVERHAGRWCVPLPQLQVLQTALCSFTRGTAFFPADCEHVGYALSSLALSYFELLLFFGKEEFLEDPLKGILDSFQECHSCLARHKNVYLLRVGQIIKDGGSWEHPVLQAILTESVQPCEKVEEYLNSEVPVFFEFRVRYLMACNRIQEAIVLAMRCLEHPVMCRHPYFHQAYLTCLWKASLYDRLHKEMAAIDGRDAVEIICNTESEQKDEMLLALCKEFLTQQLQNGDMYYLWDLIFIWSKLHLRANPSRQDFLEECHQLMWSATNVRSIFPLMKVVRFELGNEGLHFCVELCARALRMDPHLDPVTLSLIYKTIAFLLPNDLEVCRACALLVFFLERSVESYRTVYRLYMRPDQEYYADSGLIKNHMRFEILQILKKGLIFDPEFWNLVALRTSCLKLMSEKVMKDALNEIVEEDEWIPNDHVKEPYKLHVDSSNCYASRVVRPPVKERYKPVFKRIVVPPEVSGMPQVKRRGRKPGSRVIKVIEDFQPRRSYRQLEVAEEESIRRCGRRQRRRHARQVEKTTLRQRETRWLLGGDRGPVEEGDPKARNTAIPPVEALLSKRDGAGDDGDVEMAQEASQGQVDEGALIPLPALQETAGPHGEPVLLPFAPLHDVSLTPPINANLLEVSLPDNEVMDGFFTELRVEILPPVHISQEASIGEESIGVEKSPIADCVFEPCEKADPPIQYLDESSAMSSGVKAEMFVDSTNEVDNASIQRFHNYCKIPEGAANEDVPFSVDVPEQFSSVPKEMKPDSCQSWEEPSEEVSDGTLAEEETSLQRSAGFGPDLRESKGGDEHDTELADDICESPLEESVSDGTVGVPDDTKNVPDSPANVLHNQASDFYDATCDPDDATCVPGTTGVCSERTAVIGPTGVCGDRTAVIGPTGVSGDRTAVIGPTGVCGDRTAVIGPTACAVTDAVSDTASSPTGPEQEQAQSEATDSEQASTAPSPSPLPKAESSILTHRCRLCNKEFRGGNVLRHAIAHLQKDKLKCMFCRKLFNRGLVAKRHVVEHVEALKTSTAGEKRTTDSLGSLTQSLTLTEKHKRKSTSSAQERICTRRRKLTSVPEDLSGKASRPRKRKASAQNGIEEHRCPGEGCPRTFKNKGVAMLRHMKSHPGDVKVQEYSFQLRKGKCQFCSRQFDHLQHFQDHFRRHEHPLKHACFHHGCEDRFKTLAELRGHTKSHRPLQAWCAFEGCSQRFTQVSQLHHHEQRHYMPSGMVEEEPERIWVRPKPKDLLSAERGCRTQKEPANPMPCPAGSAGCGVKNTTEVKDQNVSAENGAGEMLVESESPDCVSCGISGKELINGHGKTENGTTVQPSQAEVKSAVDQEASVDNKGEDSRAKVENEAKHPDPAVQGHGKVEAEPSPYGGTSKKPFVRPPPSAYLDEKFISMPKRRKLSSVHLPSPVQLSGSQRQRCTRCFSSFSSADHLQSHLSSNKCTSLFGFDSDEEGAGEW